MISSRNVVVMGGGGKKGEGTRGRETAFETRGKLLEIVA